MTETLQRFFDITAALIFVVCSLIMIVTYIGEKNYHGSQTWFRDQLNGIQRVFLWRRYFVFSALAAAWLAASFSTDQKDDPESQNLEEGP